MENQLGNSDFKDEIDYAPKRIFKLGKCQWTDLMSRNWSWMQAVSFTHIFEQNTYDNLLE